MRKFLAAALALSAALSVASCSQGEILIKDPPVDPPEKTDFMSVFIPALEDRQHRWTSEPSARINLDGPDTSVTGPGASFSDGVVTIAAAGSYEFSGVLTGQIVVQAQKDDVVCLILNSASVTNPAGPAVLEHKSKKTVILLRSGTLSQLRSEFPSGHSEDDPWAAVYAKDDLSVTGEGSLAVFSSGGGIRSQGRLVVTGGGIEVTSSDDALRGKDGLVIAGGEISLDTGADALKSTSGKDPLEGFILMSGGELDITCAGDAMQAESSVCVSGGKVSATAGGGSGAVKKKGDPDSAMGIKAVTHIQIASGNIFLDTRDDAVHSKGSVSVTSASLTILSADDGIHAGSSVVISGGRIAVEKSYEGIEGMNVLISGGSVLVRAKDDAVNSAGGSDSTEGSEAADAGEGTWVKITGGNIVLAAGSDGIDANGDIFITGGSLAVSGSSKGADGALDADGDVIITGGSMCASGYVQRPAASSSQNVILVSFTSKIPAGSVLELRDSSSVMVLSMNTGSACTVGGFASPEIVEGRTYGIFVNSKKMTDVLVTGPVTGVSDDGGDYNPPSKGK